MAFDVSLSDVQNDWLGGAAASPADILARAAASLDDALPKEWEAGRLSPLLDPHPFAGIDPGGLADLAGTLPPDLLGPDATGEVPTGAASVTREEALSGAVLSASARIVRAIGPEAESVTVEGRGFAVVDRYDDPATGFDAIRLRAFDDGTEVFVLDGLEVGSAQDTLAALTLGETQAGSAEFQRLVGDARDAALAGRAVEMLGPSLGGALAQVAAYETAEALRAAGAAPATGSIRLVTVDALGGRDAAEAINAGALDPAMLDALNAVNLRTEGDLVSRISSHIGETISFRPVDRDGQPVVLSPEEAHVNVESLLATLRSDALFEGGTRGAPDEIGGFARLSDLAADRFVEAVNGTGLLEAGEAEIPLQVPGTARFDATGTQWSLDADQDGMADMVVGLSARPADTADLVFG